MEDAGSQKIILTESDVTLAKIVEFIRAAEVSRELVALKSVPEQARVMNLKFNPNKEHYKCKEVKYLGFIFNEDGMSVDPIRVESIKYLKSPSDEKE
ncbi:hypothetical protein JTB14_019636 [Gonioctena quinquepunctata]|nr:hypothetical protein JTB14_019636 [Gonioctena quinquepunctata]